MLNYAVARAKLPRRGQYLFVDHAQLSVSFACVQFNLSQTKRQGVDSNDRYCYGTKPRANTILGITGKGTLFSWNLRDAEYRPGTFLLTANVGM